MSGVNVNGYLRGYVSKKWENELIKILTNSR